MENVFFGENGLTSTSANFIANQAKEYVESLKEYLSTTNFLDSTIELIGSGKETLSKKGFSTEEVRRIDGVLNSIVSAYSLIAWLREALKAKENIDKQLRAMDINEWEGTIVYRLYKDGNITKHVEKYKKDPQHDHCITTPTRFLSSDYLYNFVFNNVAIEGKSFE